MKQDHYLFISLIGVLSVFGLLMVHSASITSWPTEFERINLSRHAVFLMVGILAAGVCVRLPERFWVQAAPYLFLVTVADRGTHSRSREADQRSSAVVALWSHLDPTVRIGQSNASVVSVRDHGRRPRPLAGKNVSRIGRDCSGCPLGHQTTRFRYDSVFDLY